MRIVLDANDFMRLSEGARGEILGLLDAGASQGGKRGAANSALRWRRPYDLSLEQARKLLHGMPEEHLKRLRLFAGGQGRVRLKDLLGVTRDKDIRVLSHFEGTLTRKLRRLLNDNEKKATLLGWDYDATQWSDDGAAIADGVYYVTPPTARSLKAYFDGR